MEKRNDIKGFIPVTVKNGKQTISYVNIHRICDVGDYRGGTCLSLGVENTFIIEETLEEVLMLIQANQCFNQMFPNN